MKMQIKITVAMHLAKHRRGAMLKVIYGTSESQNTDVNTAMLSYGTRKD
jgi:hypothetical protein